MIKIIIKIKTFISKQIVDIKTYGTKELLRKFYLLIKFSLRIPIDIIAIVPCITIRLIRPWIIVRIVRINAINYGNFALDTAVYYCKKKLKIDQPIRKNLDLLYIHYGDKIYNKQLVKMWKRKLNFLSGYLLGPIDRVNKFIPGWRIHTIESFVMQVSGDFDKLFTKCQSLNFTPEEEIYGKEMLKKFGLKEGDKFVCLAVRDGGHQLKKVPSRFKNWSYHSYRNYDIDDFVLAAESLAERGYYVFRMGTYVEKSLNVNNPKIIDYANSNLRDDFMDVYLGAKCSFCLSTGLGFDDVPYIFRKPIAAVQCPIGDISWKHVYNENYLFMTQHHVLQKENRRLSLSEIFSHGVAYAYRTEIFKQKGIELVNNTPEEIKDLAIEMAENLEFKTKLNPEDEELQKTFKSLFASNIKRINSHKGSKDLFYKLHNQIRCHFCTKFLRENKNWLR